MGIFDILRRSARGAKAEAWGRWCAKVMVITFFSVKNSSKGKAPPNATYAWLARKSLLLRNDWKQVGETEFMFVKSGETITVPDESNFNTVVHQVIDVEYGYDLRGLAPWETIDMLQLAHAEAEKVLTGE